MEKELYNGPFRIIQYDKISTLIFATLTFEEEEFIIRFRAKNLEKIIEYIYEWYWKRDKEDTPTLKQRVKCRDNKLFFW